MCRAQHIFNNKLKCQEKIRIHSCLVFPRDYLGKLFLRSSYHSRKMQDSCILCHICQLCEEVLGILTTLSLHVAVTKINFLDNLNIRSQIIFFSDITNISSSHCSGGGEWAPNLTSFSMSSKTFELSNHLSAKSLGCWLFYCIFINCREKITIA